VKNIKQNPLLLRVLSGHPAFFATGLYFVASSIGLVYSWAFLRGFGINVFHYAEPSDFLLASLKEPLTWLLTILALLLTLLDNALSRHVEQKGPSRFFGWYTSERYRQYNYVTTVVAIIAFLFFYASAAEMKVRDGEGDVVTVHVADGSPPKQLIMLATTVKFLFFYDHTTQRIDIHPIESVMMLSATSPDPSKDPLQDSLQDSSQDSSQDKAAKKPQPEEATLEAAP
jgi:hypothetical protein